MVKRKQLTRKRKSQRGGSQVDDQCYYRRRTRCADPGVYSKKNSLCVLDPVGIASCRRRPMHETDVDTGKCVTVLEDQFKIVRPDQWICFGSAVSSCLTITIVMNNHWKVATHMQPGTYTYSFFQTPVPTQNKPFNSEFLPYQFCNPKTVLVELKNVVRNHPDFKDAMIKYIHIAAAQQGLYFYQKTKPPRYIKTNLNSTNTTSKNNLHWMKRKNELAAQGFEKVELNDRNKRTFFSSIFPGKISDATKIFIELGLNINGRNKGFIYILEDGTLQYQNHGPYKKRNTPYKTKNGAKIPDGKGGFERELIITNTPASPLIVRP